MSDASLDRDGNGTAGSSRRVLGRRLQWAMAAFGWLLAIDVSASTVDVIEFYNASQESDGGFVFSLKGCPRGNGSEIRQYSSRRFTATTQ